MTAPSPLPYQCCPASHIVIHHHSNHQKPIVSTVYSVLHGTQRALPLLVCVQCEQLCQSPTQKNTMSRSYGTGALIFSVI